MLKPEKLSRGDKIAIVSLSWGGLGDEKLIHKYYIAKERLENEFGLEVVAMPNALKGSQFVYEHPEARAKDLMDAFKDETIKGIFCAIGGDDTVRLLPYIDYEVIKNNPKIFMRCLIKQENQLKRFCLMIVKILKLNQVNFGQRILFHGKKKILT